MGLLHVTSCNLKSSRAEQDLHRRCRVSERYRAQVTVPTVSWTVLLSTAHKRRRCNRKRSRAGSEGERRPRGLPPEVSKSVNALGTGVSNILIHVKQASAYNGAVVSIATRGVEAAVKSSSTR